MAQLGLSFCPAPTLMEGLLSITLVSLVSRTPSWYTALVCLWRAKEAYTEPGARSRRCPEGEPCRWSSFSHYPGEGPLQSPRAIWGWSSQGWARFVLPKLQDSLAAGAEGTRWRSSTHSYLNLNTLERVLHLPGLPCFSATGTFWLLGTPTGQHTSESKKESLLGLELKLVYYSNKS